MEALEAILAKLKVGGEYVLPLPVPVGHEVRL
jgi:hypothetical protein